MIVEKLIQALREREEKKAREYPHYIHASELGNCAISVALRLLGKKPLINDDKLLTLSIGIAQHTFFSEILKLPEPPFQVCHNLKLVGTCDHIIEDTIIEYKTISTFAYKVLQEPYQHHKVQLNAYMYLYYLDKSIILYINKDTGQIKEFEVKYDGEEEIIRKVKKIWWCVELMKRNETVTDYQAQESWECRYCFYRDYCPCPITSKKNGD